jgi:hypothetical protein
VREHVSLSFVFIRGSTTTSSGSGPRKSGEISRRASGNYPRHAFQFPSHRDRNMIAAGRLQRRSLQVEGWETIRFTLLAGITHTRGPGRQAGGIASYVAILCGISMDSLRPWYCSTHIFSGRVVRVVLMCFCSGYVMSWHDRWRSSRGNFAAALDECRHGDQGWNAPQPGL